MATATLLRKVLKLRTVISTSAGMAMATSCYLAGMQVATMLAGELAWISILVAGSLCLLSALCFSELTAQYPTAAGIKLFIQNAFNERVAIAIGMFYVLMGITMVGAESYLLSSVLMDSLPLVSPAFDRVLWVIAFIAFVGFINVRGVKLTGLVQDILTYAMLLFLVGVSLYTFTRVGVDIPAALAHPKLTWGNVLNAAGVGVFLYVGFEWVTPLAEETTDYRMIGRGMLWAIGILSVTYSLFTVAMFTGLSHLAPEFIRRGTDIPHIEFGRALFGGGGVLFFVAMSILASVTSFNSGLLNTSRFAYAMARDNVLPKIFSRIHPDYATPWFAILGLMVFALVVCFLILFSGRYMFIIIMAAALECFIYVVMALCVIRLRRKFPDRERSFQAPGGYLIPALTVVIFLGLLIGIFFDVTRDHTGKILFANGWVALVMAGFFLGTALYTLYVVPIFKKKAADLAGKRVKRRPGKSAAEGRGSET